MRITVFLGGTSSERDVSLASGLRIIDALRGRGHQVAAVDPASGPVDAAAEAALRGRKVDVAPPSLDELARLGKGGGFSAGLVELPAVREADLVFLALHGGYGEDGTVQALLDLAGVRYTGSGHLASALAMDKHLSKVLFRAAEVGTADWLMAPPPDSGNGGGRSRERFFDEVEHALGMPVVVKPSKQGSSVALTVVRERSALAAAVDLAFRYDDEVMVEQFVAGRELTVGVIGDRALPVLEIIPKNEIYDYEAKYTPGMAVEKVAELGDSTRARLEEQALRAFRALKLRGCARIDFRMDELGNVYCLEANTLPGMTRLSLIPQAAEAAGILFPALCERIVGLAGRG